MLKNILKLLFGNIFSKLYPFLILNIIGVYLNTSAVGVYAFYIAITSIAIVFITGGISPVIVRYLAVKPDGNEIKKIEVLDFSICTALILTFLVLSSICLYGGGWFQFDYNNLDFFIYYILLTIIGLVFSTLIKSTLTGLRLYNYLLVLDLLIAFISFLGLVVTYLLSGYNEIEDFLKLSTILAIINGFLSFALLFYFRIKFYSSYVIRFNVIKKMFNFGWPSLLSALIFSPVLLLGKFFLEKSHGLEAVGEFELTFQWATMLLIITGVISGLALPDMASVIDSKKQVKDFYRKYLKINIIVSILMGLFIYIFIYLNKIDFIEFFPIAKEISNLLLILALITALFISIWSIQTKVCAVFEKQLSVTKLNFIWIILCIFLMFFLIPIFGVEGMIISISISWFVLIVIFHIWNKRFFRREYL